MRSLIGKSATAIRNFAGPPDYVGRAGSFSFASRLSAPAAAQMEAIGSNGTLFSIVDRLATATAKVEWKLYRKAASGIEEDRVEVTSHPALSVWNRPNNFYTRNRFVHTVQQHCDLTGEQWWIVIRDQRLRSLGPLELWPVRPDRMAPVPDREKFIAGYVYTSPSGEKVPLEVDDVIQVVMPNPLDPYRGLGPVQSIMVEIDSARYTAEWNRNFFLNSAQPGGVIEVPGDLGDTEFDQMTSRWREQHKGVNAAHRVAVLENGARWVPNTFTQRDMQFTELRSVSRDAIREAFGIPKFALGDVDDVNRAQGEASNAFFAEHLSEPRLDRVKEALNTQFLPLFYPGGWRTVDVEFDYASPVPPDLDREAANLASSVSAATALVTQIGTEPTATLEAFGLPALPLAAVETPDTPGTVAPTATEEAAAQAAVLAQVVSGTGTVVALDEARALLTRAGWPIDPFRQFETPEPASVPADGEDEAPSPGTGSGASGTDAANGAPGIPAPVDARRGERRPSRSHMINSIAGGQTYQLWSDLIPVGGAWRPRNAREDDAGLDPDRVQSDWERVLAALLAAWAAASAVQRDRLAEQIRAAITGNDPGALAALSVSTSDAAADLLEALTSMSELAAAAVVREAGEQGVDIEPAEPDHHTLTVLAGVTASLLGAALANSAGREASRWLGYGRDGDTVARETTSFLEGLSDAFPRANLGHALTRAQNMARTATFERAANDGHRVRWYASEILDGNTCKPCAKIDGKELPTLEAMILAYGGGPYLYCLGTIRCRGLAIGVWES